MRTVVGRRDRVIVVGAGLGGLSAALHLAGRGHEVTVIERESRPGGRCGLISEAGYRFDTGPSVLTMPQLIERPLAAVGERLADWLTLTRLDPAYRGRFADGSVIDVHTDPIAMVDEITRTCGARDAAGYRRMVQWLTELYEVEMPHFIDRNLDSPFQLLNGALLRLVRLGAFRRLAPRIGSFVKDERLRRLFTFQAMYAGLAPEQALAIFGVITYMDCVEGVYFPEGGMHALPAALAAAAAKHGVQFRYATAVTHIETKHGRATAVRTDAGQRLPADVVVVNADLPAVYRDLLDDRAPRPVGRLRYSPSCVVVHAGGPAIATDAHHTISFGTAWKRTFDEVLERGELMSDPSFLLGRPTLTDPSLGPDGRQSYYALFPAPNLDRREPIDWDRAGSAYTDRILDTIHERFPLFDRHPEVVRTTTPGDWRAQGLAAGSPFAAAHTFRQSGAFRPPTLDRNIENLVFCGSNTQPGVGVPMVLLSGELAAEAGDRRRAEGPPVNALDAAGITDPALRHGYQQCRRLNARHGKSYYLATLLLPPAKRPYVHALYGFARAADDIVDRPPSDDRTHDFRRWRAEVRAELDWGSSSDPVRRALLDTIRRWNIPTRYVEDFLDSMAMDLTVTGYRTDADLESYMWGSAAVIGLEMLPILGRADESVRWDELETAATNLGIAFQLTNFLRDVEEDLELGRIYLPEQSLQSFGVDRERLLRRKIDEPIRNLLSYEVARTRERYALAVHGIELVHPTSRDCLRTAITLYSGILDEIEAADYDVFSGRVAVPNWRRAVAGSRGLVSAVRARHADRARARPTE